MPPREVDRRVVRMANRTTGERTSFAENAHASTPAGFAAELRSQSGALSVSEAVRRMAGMMPDHFAGAADEFIDDVRLAAAGTNQRFTPVDAQGIDVDARRHEEPLTLTDECARVPTMEIGVAQAGALRDFADRAGHQAILRRGHGGARYGRDEPMTFIEAAQESLRLGAGI